MESGSPVQEEAGPIKPRNRPQPGLLRKGSCSLGRGRVFERCKALVYSSSWEEDLELEPEHPDREGEPECRGQSREGAREGRERKAQNC